jgi:hypothetical protein
MQKMNLKTGLLVLARYKVDTFSQGSYGQSLNKLIADATEEFVAAAWKPRRLLRVMTNLPFFQVDLQQHRVS